MNLQLNGKVIVISHDLYNISKSLTNLLLKEGAIPVIISKEINSEHNYFLLSSELFITEAYKQVIGSIINKFGRIDALVNNVTQFNDIKLEHTNPDIFIQSIQTNTIDCFLLTQQVLPALKKTKGSIVNITLHNNTSNHNNLIDARTALTREWAVDFLKYEIRVNALVLKSLNYFTEDKNEIANAVAFLLSERSGHTTGQIISVD